MSVFKDVEAWMINVSDELDDRGYLIDGAVRKFGVSKADAEKIYNKVMRDNKRETMFEMVSFKKIIKEVSIEWSVPELAKSVFSLAKYNNGNWKSEKQREFFKGKTGGRGKETWQFGLTGRLPFGSRGYHNHHPVEYTVYCDDQGITRIVKTKFKKTWHDKVDLGGSHGRIPAGYTFQQIGVEEYWRRT